MAVADLLFSNSSLRECNKYVIIIDKFFKLNDINPLFNSEFGWKWDKPWRYNLPYFCLELE